jgi:hypothetical protein
MHQREPTSALFHQTSDATARGKVHESMLEARPLRAWLPRRSNVFIAVNDDAHSFVADMVDQL